MSFELTIAARKDPAGVGTSAKQDSPPKTSATIVLKGTLDGKSMEAVRTLVDDTLAGGAVSILVELRDVDASEQTLRDLGDRMMLERNHGLPVQVIVKDRVLHERMAALPRARDWLLAFTESDVGGARKAIHVDGIGTTEPG